MHGCTGTAAAVALIMTSCMAVLQAEGEQTNSALALGVCIDRELNVKSAGGYLVQVRGTVQVPCRCCYRLAWPNPVGSHTARLRSASMSCWDG